MFASPRQMSSNSVSSISDDMYVDYLNNTNRNREKFRRTPRRSMVYGSSSKPFVESIMRDFNADGQSSVYDPDEFDRKFGTNMFGSSSKKSPPSIFPWFFTIVIILFVITMTVFVIWAIYTYIVDTAPQAAEQIEDDNN